MQRSPEEWLPEIKTVLDELGIESSVAGAVAAVEYRASYRSTTDLDFVISQHKGIKEAFESRGYEVKAVSNPPDADPYLYIILKDNERTDLIVAETKYQILALNSAGTYLRPEDIVAHKLIAWRNRDREDIKSILKADHSLDIDYIEHWAAEWDITSRWEEAQSWDR